jgi:hypothetical protein
MKVVDDMLSKYYSDKAEKDYIEAVKFYVKLLNLPKGNGKSVSWTKYSPKDIMEKEGK